MSTGAPQSPVHEKTDVIVPTFHSSLLTAHCGSSYTLWTCCRSSFSHITDMAIANSPILLLPLNIA